MQKIKRVRVDDVIDIDLMNGIIDAANAAHLSVVQSCGLNLVESPGGYNLGTAMATPIWAKITGAISGGTYPFTQQLPAASGTWTTGKLTGNSYEVNGNTSVTTNTIVRIYRLPSGAWGFNASTC